MACHWLVGGRVSGSDTRFQSVFANPLLRKLTSLADTDAGDCQRAPQCHRNTMNRIVSLHSVLPGPARQSYGLQVAQLAGVPKPVIERARQHLRSFEQPEPLNQRAKHPACQAKRHMQVGPVLPVPRHPWRHMRTLKPD